LFCFYTPRFAHVLPCDIFEGKPENKMIAARAASSTTLDILRHLFFFVLVFDPVLLDTLYMVNALLRQFACFYAQYDFLFAAAYKKALHLCHYEQYVSAVVSHCNESKSITVCLAHCLSEWPSAGIS